MTAPHKLPEIPLDDTTLDLLEKALRPDEDAECSSLYSFLEMLSQLGGSDTGAVAEDDGDAQVMRDPQYSTHDLIGALVDEVRRLRAESRVTVETETLIEVKKRIGWNASGWDVLLVLLVVSGVIAAIAAVG